MIKRVRVIRNGFLSILLGFVGLTASAQVSLVEDFSTGDTNFFGYNYSNLVEYNGDLYFSGNDGRIGDTIGEELYKYDPFEGKIALAANIRYNGSSSPRYLTAYKGKLYFQANDGLVGKELWSFDGTNAELVMDFWTPGAYKQGDPKSLFVHEDTLFFSAGDGVNGFELWKFDGTTVSIAADIDGMVNAYGGGRPESMVSYDGDLYYKAYGGANGTELHKYDGVNDTEVENFGPLGSNGHQGTNAVYNDKLYFTGNDGSGKGTELYVYDAVSNTISLVKDIKLGSSGSSPKEFLVHDNKLYFTADDGVNGNELWVYDGVSTSMVQNLSLSSGSYPKELTEYNNEVYFSAEKDMGDRELFKYNGDTIVLVDEIYVGGSGDPVNLLVFEGFIYMRGDNAANGEELFRYEACEVPSIDAVAEKCIYHGSVALNGVPVGGTFSGVGVNGLDFDPATAGLGSHTVTYEVVAGPSGCITDNTIDIVVDACTDVEEIEKIKFNIFPSPNNGQFTLTLKKGSYVSVEILNILGELVYTKELKGNTNHIDLGTAESGIYFLKIMVDGVVSTSQFLIE